MSDNAGNDKRGGGWMTVVVTVAACAMLIGAAAGTSHLIFSTEPTAQRESATRRTAALVETIVAERSTYRPRLEVLGVVEPARNIVLSPRVSGQIIGMHEAFVPGGLVAEGQELLRIDPADFERALTAEQSALRQVKAELAIEQGRQDVARQEFELLGEEIGPEDRSLVLREPQIESIRARLQAAESDVEQARLDLDRTTVRAPFDAQILTREVNLGSQVSPGEPLGRLVGVDEYWVMASVPLRDLRWLRFPADDEPGSFARVRHDAAWTPDEYREARVARLIGTVNEETRLARVLVTVPDPLARETDGPPMILGTIVEVLIEGRPLEDVVRIDREYLRQGETVWVMAGDELEIREAEVVFRDAEHAYLSAGVEAGEHIVTTSLATVTDGLPLRRAGDRGDEADGESAVARGAGPS